MDNSAVRARNMSCVRVRKKSIHCRRRPTKREGSSVDGTVDVLEMLEKEIHVPVPNSKEIYRQIIFDIYKEEERMKKEKEINLKNIEIPPEEEVGTKNIFSRLIFYLSTEHEVLLQVILFLPLTLMALYIVVVEGGSLFRVVDDAKNG